MGGRDVKEVIGEGRESRDEDADNEDGAVLSDETAGSG